MSLLSRLIQYFQGFLHKEDNAKQPRVFLQDEELVAAIKDVARQQNRAEEEIIADFTKAGLNQLWTQNELEALVIPFPSRTTGGGVDPPWLPEP